MGERAQRRDVAEVVAEAPSTRAAAPRASADALYLPAFSRSTFFSFFLEDLRRFRFFLSGCARVQVTHFS